MRLDLGNNNISLNTAGLSESDIAYEYMSTSLTCAEMIREIDNDLTVMDNLIQIGSYLKQYGATEAFVSLVDANGQLSDLIGHDYSLERLDDAIWKFSDKITEKLNWFFTRLGHKISTWFPTINRYEKLYNEGVSALRSREVDYEAVLNESVRGIKASKLQSVLKFRKDSLADLKKAVQMIDGGVEQMLSDFDDTTIFRFGVIAVYKKDSLFQKLFQKQELRSLGYDASSLKRVVDFGKEMFDLYDDFQNPIAKFNSHRRDIINECRPPVLSKEPKYYINSGYVPKADEQKMLRVKSDAENEFVDLMDLLKPYEA